MGELQKAQDEKNAAAERVAAYHAYWESMLPPRTGLEGIAPPAIGERTLLIHGECDCGWWCAMHEGARWPKCPCCGEQVWPLSSPHDRAQDGLGYDATLTYEIDLLKLMMRERLAREKQMTDAERGRQLLPNPRRHFTGEQIRAIREYRAEAEQDAADKWWAEREQEAG